MRFLDTFELLFRCCLIVLAVRHIFRSEFKLIKPLVIIFILTFLPSALTSFLKMNIDTGSIFLYDLILLMSLYFGGSLRFYDKYSWWDRTVHFLSGFTGIGFGIAIINLQAGILPWLSLSFGFAFSTTLHVFWEVLEYAADCISHGNAQRWQKIHDSKNHISAKAIQPAGLVDTMNDLICCLCGAVLATVLWWLLYHPL